MSKTSLFVILISVLLILFTPFEIVNSQSIDDDSIDYCHLLYNSLLFYQAQKSGKMDDNIIPWRNDSFLNDGEDVGLDLSGGYFDAGDYIKFGFPMAFTMTTLAWGYIENENQIDDICGLSKLYLQTLKHGTDWLMSAHPSDNELYVQVGLEEEHNYWVNPWELKTVAPSYVRKSLKIDSGHPGTDIAHEAAAALASSSIVWRSIDSSYADKCLSHAKSLYSFGKTYLGKYSDSVPQVNPMYTSSDYKDEMAWASTWLYLATQGTPEQQQYEQDVKNNFNNVISTKYYTDKWSCMFSWDSKFAGTAILIASRLSSLGLNAAPILNQIQQTYLNSSQKLSNGVLDIDIWGNNRYAMGGAFLLTLINTSQSTSFAQQQLHCILGECSQNSQSYMVGYNNGPINLHHRAAHQPDYRHSSSYPVDNTNVLIGALVGGDSNSYKWSDTRDLSDSYKYNEPAIDYNAAFTVVLSTFVTRPSEIAASSCISINYIFIIIVSLITINII